MWSIKVRPMLDTAEAVHDSSSDSDDELPALKKIVAVPKTFRARKDKVATESASSLFTIDTNPGNDLDSDSIQIEKPEPEDALSEIPVDPELQKLLSKAVCGPQYEKGFGQNAQLLGRRALKRARKVEEEKTNGKNWFDMPATELTDETRMDLELLQMRSALDPNTHYRRNDRSVLPKYFQVGKVVDAPEDYYSGRIVKKDRKKTMVDELLNDHNFMQNRQNAFKKIQTKNSRVIKGAFQGTSSKRQKKKDNWSDRISNKSNNKDKKKKKGKKN